MSMNVQRRRVLSAVKYLEQQKLKLGTIVSNDAGMDEVADKIVHLLDERVQ